MIGRQQILQAEAVDRVGVAAAHFHEAIVPLRIGQPADLVGGPGDQFRFAKLVDKSHGYPHGPAWHWPSLGLTQAVSLHFFHRRFALA